MSSTGALFTFLLENKRDVDLVRILQEYALNRSDSIKYKSLLTEMRSLKTHVVDVLFLFLFARQPPKMRRSAPLMNASTIFLRTST